jgi:hypothetical protein
MQVSAFRLSRRKNFRTNCLPAFNANVLAVQTNENSTMLWLYVWAAAPYVVQIAADCLSEVWNGRAPLISCAERLASAALGDGEFLRLSNSIRTALSASLKASSWRGAEPLVQARGN